MLSKYWAKCNGMRLGEGSWSNFLIWKFCFLAIYSQICDWHKVTGWVWSWLTECLGEGNGTPLQYSCLENPMDRGAWWAAVHGVAKSWTQLSDFTLTFHFHALEKEMATHSSILAWRIPGTGEPAGLPSMGSHKVGHDRGDLAAAAAQTSSGIREIQTKTLWDTITYPESG